MKKLVSAIVLLATAAPGYGWNNTGHMVAARLAWLQLSADQRAQAVTILKRHPHYDEFLAVDKPDGFSEEEWVFLRAATWPDWVRNHHKQEYHHSTWHFINYPFAPDGSVDISTRQPPPDEQNIVRQLDWSVRTVRNGTQEEQPVALCWLLHLVGDVHQPLHTAALFSLEFPDGDRGGNLAYVVLHEGADKTRLHPMWDGLLGKSIAPSAIGRVVKQVTTMLEQNPDLIRSDLEEHKTYEAWAKESFEAAKRDAYLNGQLPIGVEDDDSSDIPVAPDDYARNAGRTARVQIAKAGARIATAIGDAIR